MFRHGDLVSLKKLLPNPIKHLTFREGVINVGIYNYWILGILLVLIFLIYQKINSGDNLGVERAVNTWLGEIRTKLTTIAETKEKIEGLQGDMVDFKNLFNNKTERGKFGEEYLEDIVKDSINKKHYKFQHTLSNSKRPDCFLTFGSAEESICID